MLQTETRDLTVKQHIPVALKKPGPNVNVADKPVSVASEVSCVATRYKVLASSNQGVYKCHLRSWQTPFKVLTNSTEGVSKLNSRCQKTLFKMSANSTQGVCKLHSRCLKMPFMVLGSTVQGVCQLQSRCLQTPHLETKFFLQALKIKTQCFLTAQRLM